MLQVGTRYTHDWITLSRGEFRTTEFDVLERTDNSYVVRYDQKDPDSKEPGLTGTVQVGSKRDLQAEPVK